MKELSIEERAQRYDEAIERAKNIKTGKCETTFIFTEGLFDYLFPEIKECNEEEVRKAMIDFFKHERVEGVTTYHYGVNIERMIAWLEKQTTSEKAMQYLKENHSPSEVSDFQATMNIAVAKAYDKGVKDELERQGQTFTKEDVDDAWLKGMCDAKHELEKQGERKPQRMISAEAKEAMYGNPAWSEKDEKTLADACVMLDWYKGNNWWKAQYIKDWLKSLKGRVGCEANCTSTKEWSVEDKSKVQRICKYLDEAKKYYADITEVRECMDWLKSLKQRIGE